MGGTLAVIRTQKGWEFMDREGCRVQVRSLANPTGRWVNGQPVDFRGDGCDRYALVVFEGLEAKSLLVFERDHLADVGQALNKRHPNEDTTLQLGQADYRAIMGDPEKFANLGVQVFTLST